MVSIHDVENEVKTVQVGPSTQVPQDDWKLGYDSKGESKTRIIITFKNDQGTWVKIYDRDPGVVKVVEDSEYYYCIGCLTKQRIKVYSELKADHTFHNSNFHDCQLICAKKNAVDQMMLEEKFMKAQRSAAATPVSSAAGGSGRSSSANPFLINEQTSPSPSPIFVTPESPTRAATSSTARQSLPIRSTSPVVVYSSSNSSQTSRSGKQKISSFFSPNSTQKSTSKTKQNTGETPRQLRRQSKNAKNNKENEDNNAAKNTASNAEPKNPKTKRTVIDDDVEITLIEPDTPVEDGENLDHLEHPEFDDHPSFYDTNPYPPQQEPAATVTTENEQPSQTPAEKINEAEEIVVQQQSTNPKCLQRKHTLLEDDVVLVEVAGGSSSNVQATIAPENEPPKPVTPKPSNNGAKKNTEKLTPASINQMKKIPYKFGQFEYGVNGRNGPKGRIIVPDIDDKTLIREFQKHQGQWYCRDCHTKNKRKIKGILKNDTFLAPPKHLCNPKTRQEWKNEQQMIKDKYAVSTSRKEELNDSSSSVEEVDEPIVCRTRRSAAATATNESNNAAGSSATEAINSSSRPSTSMSSATTVAADLLNILAADSLDTVAPAAATNETREVDTCTAQYGYDENGKKKGRLIVREEDRKFAREYVVTEEMYWKCLKCNIGVASKNDTNYLVSINHECSPTPYSIIENEQKINEAKYRQLTGTIKNPSNSENHQTRCESQMSKASFNSSAQTVSGKSSTSFSSSTQQQASTSASSSSPTHYQLTADQWEWGFDTYGHEKKRIIVPDLKNPQQAYEYRNGGRMMLCLGCHNLKKPVYAARTDEEIPIICIPLPEEHICKPRILADIREQQKTYMKKGKKRGRHDAENDDFEVEEFGSKKRTRRSARIERDSETTTSPICDDDNNEDAFNNDFDSPEPLSPAAATSGDVQDEPMNEIPTGTGNAQNYALSNHTTTVKFYHPAGLEIEKLCNKLRLSYSSCSSYDLWGKIKIQHISPTSIPNVIYPVEDVERSGFACLSLFLSGTETNALMIKDTFIQCYFSQNLPNMGRYYGEDLSRINNENTIQIIISNTLTKYHLHALCQFFECRIGVFANEKWCRFGNWDNENGHVLTFLMKKDGEKFSPILSLQ